MLLKFSHYKRKYTSYSMHKWVCLYLHNFIYHIPSSSNMKMCQTFIDTLMQRWINKCVCPTLHRIPIGSHVTRGDENESLLLGVVGGWGPGGHVPGHVVGVVRGGGGGEEGRRAPFGDVGQRVVRLGVQGHARWNTHTRITNTKYCKTTNIHLKRLLRRFKGT